jgi:hypothetical protein
MFLHQCNFGSREIFLKLNFCLFSWNDWVVVSNHKITRKYFCAVGFNLNNGVTDTLESSTILIYSDERMSLYTQSLGSMPK